MYYGLILISVLMFGGCFALQDVYRKSAGNSFKASIRYSFICNAVGLVALLLINGFRFEFTWFTFVMAILSALNGFGFSYCSLKALGNINLSLYSLFSMLGGMTLPFLQGIFFFGESITVAKIVCFVLIVLALALTVERGERKKGTIYYIGVFIFNGMSGVLSKIFASAQFDKTSPEVYSILSCVCALVITGIVLLCLWEKGTHKKLACRALGAGALSGAINRLANLWLVIALLYVDASVQYPMVTGGVMIVSTAICFFKENKPSKKEVLSVFVAFVGMLALFAIPV